MPPLLFEDDARKQWDLDRLYKDFGRAKQETFIERSPVLTDTEKELLCGLLLKLSPTQIARQRHNSGSLTPLLSDTIYRYIEHLVGKVRCSLKSWRDVPDWLEASGYREKAGINDLGQMPEVTTFYGRQVELGQLKNRILGEAPCRMVSIIGPPGMGKTSLAAKLVNMVRKQCANDTPFTGGYLWQSLRPSPSIEHVLGDWLTRMPGVRPSSDAWYDQLKAVMSYFRNHRCLVVIDNLESILDAEVLGGYQEGYSSYREFLQRLGEENHQSCVIVTSRCHTPEIHGFAKGPVQDIVLKGLHQEAAEELLADQRLLKHTKGHWQSLIQLYRGNPLMLKMASRYILDLFDGDVGNFLKRAKTILSSDLRALVGRSLNQLSNDEKAVLKHLVEENRPISIDEIQNPQQIDPISVLLSRCLLEKSADGVMPIPVVVDYIRNFEVD